MSIVEKARGAGQAIVKVCPPAAYLLIPPMRLADTLQGGTLHQHMRENIDIFCTPEQKADSAYMRWLRRDMWYCAIRYLCAFNEYFMFRFPRLNHRGRSQFVTELQKVDAYQQVGTPETWRTLQNKWECYLKFQKYYHRDAILAGAGLEAETFFSFLDKHARFIAKPLNDACGNGVFLFDAAADGRSREELLAWFRGQDVILEQPIVQCADMARLHPGSVNTVRCATFYKDGHVDILFTFLRMGRGGSVVDNAGAGGFVASVDPDTGILTTPGVTESLESVLVHPDTGAQIIGWRVPRWEEMKALAREMSLAFTEQPYISWDFALTDRGWVCVEGNHAGQFVCPQFTTQHGIRDRLRPYFDL